MSSSFQSFHKAQDQQVLGELLHSLSQPLTSLRCSLELSIDEAAGQQQEAVAAALEQAERVIRLVKLMREYLDTEPGALPPLPVLLSPILRAVVEQLTSIADVRHVRLELLGRSAACIPVWEEQLRMAFQYLIGNLIEAQPAHSEVMLRLEQNATESILHTQVRNGSVSGKVAALGPGSLRDPVNVNVSINAALRRVKLAIAGRVFESGGACLTFDSDSYGFVLRVPHRPATPFTPELFS